MRSSGRLVIAVALLWVIASAVVSTAASSLINLAVLGPPEAQVRTAALAAQFEANSGDVIPGRRLNISFYDTSSLATDAERLALINAVAAQPAMFGFLMPFIDVGDVLLRSNVTLPIISPISSSLSLPFASRHVINFRAPFTTELYQLMTFALHSRTHCVHFAVITAPSGNAQAFRETVASIISYSTSYSPPLNISLQLLDGNNVTSFNVTFLLGQFFSSSTTSVVPTCVAIFGPGLFVTAVVEALHGDPRLDHDNTFFFALSISNMDRFSPTTPTATSPTAPSTPSTPTSPMTNMSSLRIFENLFLTQLLPSPIDGGSAQVTSSYQQAMRTFAAASNLTISDANFSYFSLEVYLTTRLVVEVLRGVNSTSPSVFLDEIYRRSFVKIEDMVLGPYTDSCPSSFQSFPCFCTVGSSVSFISRVDTTTGLAATVKADVLRGETGLSASAKSLQACSFSVTDVAAPLTVLLLSDIAIPALRSKYAHDLIVTLLVGATYTSTQKMMDGVGRFGSIPMNLDVTNSSLIKALYTRFNPLVAIGATSFGSNVLSVFSNLTAMQQTDPPLQTSFNKYELQLDAVLADYIHALSSFLSDPGGAAVLGSSIIVVAETDAQLRLAVKSLNTFQRQPTVAMLFSDRGWPSLLNDVLQMSTGSGSATGGAVLAIMEKYETVAMLLDNMSLAGNTTSGSRSAFIFAIACDDQFLWQYAAAGHVGPPARVAPFFATSRPLKSSSATAVITAFQALLGDAYSIVNTSVANGLPSPGAVDGYTIGTMLFSLVRNTRASLSSVSITEAIYQSGTVSNGESSFGPFYDALCAAPAIASAQPLRTCQCTKGPRKFTVLNLTEYYLQLPSASVSFTYVHAGCGVAYFPLQANPQALSNTTVMIYAAISIVIFVLLIYFISHVVRSHQFALFVRSGLWLVCVKVLVRAALIILRVFAMLTVLFGGSSLVFIIVYVFVSAVAIASGLAECVVQVLWVVAKLEARGEMDADEESWWKHLFAKVLLVALGTQDVPLLVVTFAALLQQDATVPLLLMLATTSYFAGDKHNTVQQDIIASIRKYFAAHAKEGGGQEGGGGGEGDEGASNPLDRRKTLSFLMEKDPPVEDPDDNYVHAAGSATMDVQDITDDAVELKNT